LGQSTPVVETQRLAAFLKRLRELGWIEGRTVAIEYAWGQGSSERFAEIAADFVRLKVDVIVTSGTANVIAAKQATSVIPIVFAVAGDPIANSLVASLARPGGNVTGLSTLATDLAGKRLELLREAVAGLRRLATIGNVGNSLAVLEMSEVQAAAARFGLEAAALEIRQAEDIAPAFEALRGGADALYVVADPLVNTNRARIHTLAMGARLPAIYNAKEHVEAGGLMSYGPNFPELYRRAAEYVDKILRGGEASRHPGRAADQIRSGGSCWSGRITVKDARMAAQKKSSRILRSLTRGTAGATPEPWSERRFAHVEMEECAAMP
jgi:putative ABC transport system substrate-binding protein